MSCCSPGWAGEDGTGADPAIPASGEAEQARAQQAGGEVLLGHRRVALAPALAEHAQIGKDRGAGDGLGAEGGDEPIEGGLGSRVVEVVERRPQLGGEV